MAFEEYTLANMEVLSETEGGGKVLGWVFGGAGSVLGESIGGMIDGALGTVAEPGGGTVAGLAWGAVAGGAIGGGIGSEFGNSIHIPGTPSWL